MRLRRRWLLGLMAALPLGGGRQVLAGEDLEVVLYKNPWCGCCEGWARHMEAAGFRVRRENVEDLAPVKRMAGVPPQLEACHTALVGGYVVEGHVPALAVRRLLAERPQVVGIAAPGMPPGSPGMPAPEPATYTVYAFRGDGGLSPFARFRGGVPLD